MTALVCGLLAAAVCVALHVAYRAGYRTALTDVRTAAKRRFSISLNTTGVQPHTEQERS